VFEGRKGSLYRAVRAGTNDEVSLRLLEAPRALEPASDDWPMPGNVASVAASRGKAPPCQTTTSCAARCNRCARR